MRKLSILKRILALALVFAFIGLCACVEEPTPNSDSESQSQSESQTTTEPEETTEAEDDNRILKITCWGDSITEGMAMAAGESYPAQLSKLLGEGYEVLNGGDGGENSFTIAARQGAYSLYTTKLLTFKAGVASVDIGTDGTGLDIANFTGTRRLTMRGLLGNEININDITINGIKFKLEFKNGYNWDHKNNAFVLTRLEGVDEALTLPEKSQVYLSGTEQSDIQIYYAGCNNQAPYNTSEAIIRDIQKMIDHHGCSKYIVIIPHWTSGHDAAFVEAFGDHAINLRDESIKNGLTYEGLTATATDNTLISQGLMPASLRYQNSDNDVHLNKYGYHFMAHLIYERGITLGLWE